MGIEALTTGPDGATLAPRDDDEWKDWVSATHTRNFVIQDPILDWLDLYGEHNGFTRDSDLPEYDPRTEFNPFLFRKAHEFESAVISHLQGLAQTITIASERTHSRSLEKAKETLAAMEQGVPIIYQGVLRHAESRTYGIPDLLVRTDELARLFPGTIEEEEAAQPALDLPGANWHYRVVDIKFTTLRLLAGGELGGSGSAPAHKAQLHIYNRALGRIQRYLPPVAYLLGRGWTQRVKDTPYRSTSCLDRLAPVTHHSQLRKGMPLATAVEEACDWVRRVRRDGSNWGVLPEPSVPELRPNIANARDGPFTTAKRHIAQEQEELTCLWQVGVQKRDDANALGIYRWSDPRCTAAAVSVTGPKLQPTLQAIIDINRNDGPLVALARVTAAENQWRQVSPLEFYVDFETVNDLDDDFSLLPECGGQPLIFMIGCGHVEAGEWKFSCFVAAQLTERRRSDC